MNFRRSIIRTFIWPVLVIFIIGVPLIFQISIAFQVRYYSEENRKALVVFRGSQYDLATYESMIQFAKVNSCERVTITDPNGHILAGDTIEGFDFDRTRFHKTVSSERINGMWMTIILTTDEDGYSFWDIEPSKMAYGMVFKAIIIFLLASLLSVSVSLLYYNKRIAPRINEVISGQSRMKTELTIAHGVQQSMVPQARTRHIDSILQPAREVGGDLYDYTLVGERLYFCIGDVSDKGVSAAMMMAIIRSLFHQSAEAGLPLEDIIRQLNHTVCERNPSLLFCTFFAGCININTLKMEYINCGHCAPLSLMESDKSLTPIEVIPNVVIGVEDHYDFQKQTIQLHSHDILLLYTDGVTETMNEQKEQFGLERFMQAVQTSFVKAGVGDYPIIHDIIAALTDFRGTAEQNDDIALLAIRLDNVPTLHYDTIQGKAGEIVDNVLAHVEQTDNLRLRLAVEEIVTNIVSYAYEQDGPLDVLVYASKPVEDIAYGPQLITMEFVDKGVPFNPLQNEAPDTTSDLVHRPIGGLGIFLARQIVNILYRYENGENHLTITYQA